MAKAKRESHFIKRYRQNKTAWYATWAFVGLLLMSVFASFIANSKPLIMQYEGKLYFPVLMDYSPQDMGLEGFVIDYFLLEHEMQRKDEGWMIYPPIKQMVNEPNLNFDSLPAPPGSKSTVGAYLDFEGHHTYHLLGTDTAGRDLLTRLIYGCQTSLLMAMAITILSMLLGVLLGAIMGYAGGAFDLFVGRFLETLGYFPVIFMIIILVAFLESPSLTIMIVIFAVLGIAPFAFYMRGQVLKTRKLTFVEAATALGQNRLSILLRHILPNSFSPILVLIPFTVTSNIAFLATIDFLGFGVQPPTASLGAILRSGYEDIGERWWLVLFSSIVLVTILLLVNFIGDGVRDGMDPHATVNKSAFNQWKAEVLAKRKAKPASEASS